jgi:hypothetical protein
MADWFYDEEHIGAKITPIEYLVGIANTVPIKFPAKRTRPHIKIHRN